MMWCSFHVDPIHQLSYSDNDSQFLTGMGKMLECGNAGPNKSKVQEKVQVISHVYLW